MKKKCFLIYLIVLFLLLCGCSEEPSVTEQGASVFGEFVTTDMEGNSVSEEVFKGHKLTMVNIWATFCSPCIQEMPEISKLRNEYGEEFQVIGIVVDAADRNGAVLSDKKAEAAAIIDMTGADYLNLLPSDSLNKAYLNSVQSVPETIFLDENGNQVGNRYIGARSKAEWKKIIDSLMEVL